MDSKQKAWSDAFATHDFMAVLKYLSQEDTFEAPQPRPASAKPPTDRPQPNAQQVDQGSAASEAHSQS